MAARLNFRPITNAAQNAGVRAGQYMGNGIYRGADGRLRDLRGRFVSEGALAGTLYSKAFKKTADLDSRGLGSLTFLMNKFVLAALAAAKALPTVIALVGELGTVGVAAAASLPFLITSLLLVKETFANAFKGVGDAIEAAFDQDPAALEAALKDLAPAAQAFVREIAKAAPALEAVQKDIQQKFFEPLKGGFDNLRTSGIIGNLGLAMTRIATDAGIAVREALDILAASAKSGQLANIFVGVNSFFATLAAGVPGLVKVFLDLAEAAAPFVNVLGRRLLVQMERFFDFVDKSLASGALARGFDSALGTLSSLAALLGNILDVVGSVFGALSSQGESVVGVFAELVGTVAEFFRSFEGQQALGQLADLLHLVSQSVINLVMPLLPLLVKLIDVLVGPLERAFSTLLPPITKVVDALASALVPILDALAPVLDVIIAALADSLADVLIQLADALYELTPSLVELFKTLGPAAVTVVEGFAEVLTALLPIIPDMLEAFLNIVPVIVAFLPLIVAGSQAFAGLAKVLSILVGWIATFYGAVLKWIAQGVSVILVALMDLLDEIPGVVANVFEAVIKFFTEDIPAFFGFAQKSFTEFGDTVGQLPNLIAGALSNLAGVLVQPFTTGFTDINATVTGGVGRLGEAIGAIPGQILSFAGRIYDAAARIGRNIGEGIANIPGFAVDIASRIVGRIKGFINNVIYDINRGIYNISRVLPFSVPYIPYLAKGGIIDSPTMAVIGEAGREVVLPLTDPARTRELAQESGLMDILGPSLGGQGVPNIFVFIGDEEITDRVDVRVQYAMDGQARELSFGGRGI